MANHIYLTMAPAASDVDEFGNSYPDIMTFPIDKFETTTSPFEFVVNEIDVIKPMITMQQLINQPYHDDLFLWLNDIEFKHDMEAGDKYILPRLRDISTFYVKRKR